MTVVAAAMVMTVVFGAGCSDDGDDREGGGTTTEAEATRRGPCDEIDEDALETTLGTGAVVSATDAAHCTLARTGTQISVTVDQLRDDADRSDLAGTERSSGPDADSLEPWPQDDVDDVGDAAVWQEDPAADGTYGELSVLADTRLIRITVSVPPDYRREPLAMATAVAGTVLEDLGPP
ncbi:MAG TPA: hypothetical protein VF228_12370 [Iamia sp.]